MNQKIVSTSVNQINRLTTFNGLVIQRQKIGWVRLVGQVMSVTEEETRSIMVLNDYTGTICVEIWKQNLSSQTLNSNLAPIAELDYCQIIGQAKKDESHSGLPYVSAIYIERISSLNQITIHLIEVVKHAIDLKKSKISDRCIVSAVKCEEDRLASNEYTNVPQVHGLTQIQQLLLNAIKESEIGLSVDQICQVVPAVDRDIVKRAIEFLNDEQHIHEPDNGIFKIYF